MPACRVQRIMLAMYGCLEHLCFVQSSVATHCRQRQKSTCKSRFYSNAIALLRFIQDVCDEHQAHAQADVQLAMQAREELMDVHLGFHQGDQDLIAVVRLSHTAREERSCTLRTIAQWTVPGTPLYATTARFQCSPSQGVALEVGMVNRGSGGWNRKHVASEVFLLHSSFRMERRMLFRRHPNSCHVSEVYELVVASHRAPKGARRT
uniref:Uncharacterized protein n=1 Tax=Picocystis salinarum TaxID=88271 RepID=A0A7S3UG07_9CHLO|mmetsp:Transcript_2259/g.15010  ORF Transcript_2259/g.15010 Transcript_2259/m.15010 type:complete len:207 (-) Transcript_2259:1235-1855(-)